MASRCVSYIRKKVYRCAMKKRTNMNVDISLVSQAASVLGTHGTTDTVHAAMEDVVRRARRKRLAARDLSDLTPKELGQMRKSRSAAEVRRRRQPAAR
jgi:Arc/MetJ family transcription regulator